MNPFISLGVATFGLSMFGFQWALANIARKGNDGGYLLSSAVSLLVSATSFGLAF